MQSSMGVAYFIFQCLQSNSSICTIHITWWLIVTYTVHVCVIVSCIIFIRVTLRCESVANSKFLHWTCLCCCGHWCNWSFPRIVNVFLHRICCNCTSFVFHFLISCSNNICSLYWRYALLAFVLINANFILLKLSLTWYVQDLINRVSQIKLSIIQCITVNWHVLFANQIIVKVKCKQPFIFITIVCVQHIFRHLSQLFCVCCFRLCCLALPLTCITNCIFAFIFCILLFSIRIVS